MMFMDAIHVHVKEGGKHGKSRATLLLRKMTIYERCMKVGVVLPPPPH
jgi:hypothetical protein